MSGLEGVLDGAGGHSTQGRKPSQAEYSDLLEGIVFCAAVTVRWVRDMHWIKQSDRRDCSSLKMALGGAGGPKSAD
jgi:glycerol kinase